MKKLRNISAQEQEFLNKLDALIGGPDESTADLTSELEQVGIDPEELRQAASQRIRSFASEKYLTRGLNPPPRMRDAMKQMRPPTPEEEKAAQSKRASTRVEEFLESLKRAGSAIATPGTLAPAYRNKQKETPQGDKDLLSEQQEDLDSEVDE
jgi:hypothetical protein